MNILLACIVLILWYMLFRYKRRRLYELAACIPEPPLKIPFIGAIQYTFNVNDLPTTTLKLIKKYSIFAVNNGGTVKFWGGPLFFVAITDPSDAELILKNHLDKSIVVKIFQMVVGNAGIFASVPEWYRRRKMAIPAFSSKIINSYIDILRNNSEELANHLARDQRVGTGPFKVWPYISAHNLNSVCETTLGLKENFLKNPNSSPFITATANLFHLASDRVFRIWLWPDCVYRWTKEYPVFKKSRDFVYNFTEEVIRKKRKNLENSEEFQSTIKEISTTNGENFGKVRCFLENMILLSSKEDGITDIELREEVLTFLMAGSDTSTVSVCNTLKLLAKYPKVQEKVYAEIMEVLGDPNRVVTKDDLKNLDYLKRVIKESLRLFPPIPLLIRKVFEETKMPSGITLPAGTNVIVSVWGSSRDPKYWGPDADCFDPDRFLDGRETGFYAPFSYGSRNCIGYQFAMLSIQMTLTSILRRYKVTGEEESGPVPHMDCSYNIVMKEKNDYHISLEARC